jgi:hypothetical protein
VQETIALDIDGSKGKISRKNDECRRNGVFRRTVQEVYETRLIG